MVDFPGFFRELARANGFVDLRKEIESDFVVHLHYLEAEKTLDCPNSIGRMPMLDLCSLLEEDLLAGEHSAFVLGYDIPNTIGAKSKVIDRSRGEKRVYHTLQRNSAKVVQKSRLRLLGRIEVALIGLTREDALTHIGGVGFNSLEYEPITSHYSGVPAPDRENLNQRALGNTTQFVYLGFERVKSPNLTPLLEVLRGLKGNIKAGVYMKTFSKTPPLVARIIDGKPGESKLFPAEYADLTPAHQAPSP
jgi:hypothetical protein